MTTIDSRQTFNGELERALQHLYDPTYLRGSELMALLLPDGRQSPTALQGVITRGIRALRPDSSVPPSARAWRLYQVLTMRYAEQMTQEDVAKALAYSARHVRRQELAAIETLADYLWSEHDLERMIRARAELHAPTASPVEDPIEAVSVGDGQDGGEQLTALMEGEPIVAMALNDMVASAIAVVAPLAESSGVRVEIHAPRRSARIAGSEAALRQALIGLVTAGVAMAEKGSLEIIVGQGIGEERVTLTSRPGIARSLDSSAEIDEYVAVARELMGSLGGRLIVSDNDGEMFLSRLCLPGTQCLPIVCIDDNHDILRLYERYLHDTRFQAITCADSEQGMTLAVEVGAKAIILDIMIPDVDGWELLARLRNHPKLAKVPLIVCSVLPHARLATTLGAAAFLRKPVKRDQLLSALEERVQV